MFPLYPPQPPHHQIPQAIRRSFQHVAHCRFTAARLQALSGLMSAEWLRGDLPPLSRLAAKLSLMRL